MHRCPSCGVDLHIALHVAKDEQPQPQRRRQDGSLEPAPMTPERAEAFTMPFGKFKGLSLAQIDADGHRDYLEWGARQWDRTLGRAVVGYLEFHPKRPARAEPQGDRRRETEQAMADGAY